MPAGWFVVGPPGRTNASCHVFSIDLQTYRLHSESDLRWRHLNRFYIHSFHYHGSMTLSLQMGEASLKECL